MLALLEHLRHHLGRRAIEFRAPRQAEDGRRPRLSGRRWRDRSPMAGFVSGGGLLPDVVLDLPHDADRGVGDEPPVVGVRGAALAVVLGQAKGRDGHVVVELARGMLVDVVLGDLHRLFQVAGQKALVEALLRREHRIAAEEDAQEFELRHIAADDDEADGQGRCEEQPDRTPQRGPEDRRHDDGQRRQARCWSRRAMAR